MLNISIPIFPYFFFENLFFDGTCSSMNLSEYQNMIPDDENDNNNNRRHHYHYLAIQDGELV